MNRVLPYFLVDPKGDFTSQTRSVLKTSIKVSMRLDDAQGKFSLREQNRAEQNRTEQEEVEFRNEIIIQ